MDAGSILLIVVWLTALPQEAKELGLTDVMYVRRFETLQACIKRRDEIRNGPDPLNPGLKIMCIDTDKD